MRKLVVTLTLLFAALLLAACGQAPTETDVAVVPSETPTPTLTATPTPSATATRAPTATPTPTPAATPAPPSPTPTTPIPGLTFLEVSPPWQAFPAGSTVTFGLQTDEVGVPVRYWVAGMPGEVMADFQGSPAPNQNTLLLHTAGTLTPGQYEVQVAAAIADQQPVLARIGLEVTACSELHTGVFTQAVESNLVGLTTAGKPSWEEGLLVPLQVCASDRPRRLRVTLECATSEAGTPMTTPPRFYIFRSLVWPAPDHIRTHNWGANAIRAADAAGWEMEAEITPGLWLLVFERARYGSSEDPADIPAVVTYRLEPVP